MNSIQTTDYEDMAATFQVMLIHWLHDAFQDAKCEDEDLIRKVIDNYFASMGTFVDQYWFEDAKGNRLYPCIAFSTVGPASDAKLKDYRTLYFPCASFSWHEYAMGDVSHYFDECGKSVERIPHGFSDDVNDT